MASGASGVAELWLPLERLTPWQCRTCGKRMKQIGQLMYEGLGCLSLRDPEAILLPVHCLIIGRFQQLSEAFGVQVSPFIF